MGRGMTSCSWFHGSRVHRGQSQGGHGHTSLPSTVHAEQWGVPPHRARGADPTAVPQARERKELTRAAAGLFLFLLLAALLPHLASQVLPVLLGESSHGSQLLLHRLILRSAPRCRLRYGALALLQRPPLLPTAPQCPAVPQQQQQAAGRPQARQRRAPTHGRADPLPSRAGCPRAPVLPSERRSRELTSCGGETRWSGARPAEPGQDGLPLCAGIGSSSSSTRQNPAPGSAALRTAGGAARGRLM